MEENRGVSVIIPCYNDARYLMEALGSLYAQKDHSDLSFEVIIVNDGSTDPDTYGFLEDALLKHPDITLLHQEQNMGVSAARNRGLQKARYPFIFAFDIDNKLSTDPALISGGRSYMDRCVDVLSADPDTVFVRCVSETFGKEPGPWEVPDYNEGKILISNSIDTHAMYRRREALAMGGYNENLRVAADWDFAVAMINQRHKAGVPASVHTIDDPVFLYRVREDGSSLWQSGYSHEEPIRKIIARSPEIYRSYFPEMLDSEMPAHIMKLHERRASKWNRRARLARDIENWPYLAGKLAEKSRYVFRRATFAGRRAMTPEPVIEPEELQP